MNISVLHVLDTNSFLNNCDYSIISHWGDQALCTHWLISHEVFLPMHYKTPKQVKVTLSYYLQYIITHHHTFANS